LSFIIASETDTIVSVFPFVKSICNHNWFKWTPT
jgi:hypothetical protein